MRNDVINGTDIENMLCGGKAYLGAHLEEVNNMNVFPVPDGDTGSNMLSTLQSGLTAASNAHAGKYMKNVSSNMLLGAKGNSGVILSRLFEGIANRIADCSIVNANEIADALCCGWKTAYASVSEPVEGTILTAAREGIENLRQNIRSYKTPEDLLLDYLVEVRGSVERTPSLMQALRDAGVVDSGALGWEYITEGMVRALKGEKLEESVMPTSVAEELPGADLFTENSSFTYGYCVEFVLQLMNARCNLAAFQIENFRKELSEIGDSIEAIPMETRIKGHVHTLKPSGVFETCQRYGEFVHIRIENMEMEHMAFVKKHNKLPRRSMTVITSAGGAGFCSLLNSFENVTVLNDGNGDISVKAFLEAFNQANADHIVVLPNHKNVIRAAEQAASLAKEKDIVVLPSKSALAGYYAIALCGDSCGKTPEDFKAYVDGLRSSIEDIDVLSFATLVKDYTLHDTNLHKGQWLAFNGSTPIAGGAELIPTLSECLELYAEGKSGAIVSFGQDISQELRSEVKEQMQHYSDIDAEYIEGAQPIYSLVIGLI